MWIINHNDAVKRLYDEDLLGDLVDDPVEDLPGDERGIVFARPTQVTKEVGETLIAAFDDIEEYDNS